MSDSSTKAYIAGLIRDARCFACYDGKEQLNVQTYLLAFIAGLSTVPSVLAAAAKCLDCLTLKQLTQVRTYLYARLSGNSIDTSDLLDSAACYTCIPPKLRISIQTYLLTQDPNGPGTTDLKTLSTQAKLFKSLDKKVLFQIQVLALATSAGILVNAALLMALAKCMHCLTEPELVIVAVQTLDFIEPIPPGSGRDGVTPPPVVNGGTRGGGVRGGGGGGIPTCTDVIGLLVPTVTTHYVANVISTIDLLFPKGCCHPGTYEIYGSNEPSMTSPVLFASAATGFGHGQANATISGISMAGFTLGYFAVRQVCLGGAPVSALSASNPRAFIAVGGFAEDDMESYGAGQAINGKNGGSGFSAPYICRVVNTGVIQTYNAQLSAQIINARFVRRVDVDPSTVRVRVAFRGALNSFATLAGTPRFGVGLCLNTDNILGDATPDDFIGVVSTGANYTFNGSFTYMTDTFAPYTNVGGVETFGANFATSPSGGSSLNYCFFVDIYVKSAGLLGMRLLVPNLNTADATKATFEAQAKAATPAVANHTWNAEQTVAHPTAGNIWANRCLNISWNQNTRPWYMNEIIVSTFATPG